MTRWRVKAIIAGLAAAAFATAYWLMSSPSLLQGLLSGDSLESIIAHLGAWGPVLIIGLIATAVVVSPIPSAPIAVAAGAAYGHLWGTLLVLAGAELGSLIAFALARILGYDLVRKWFGDRLDVGLLGSQNVIMLAVFLSRLMPFISFDIVSYAAGLTSLSAWRFAIATMAGILPASFLLAHFGNEMATADTRRIMIAILALGAVTAVPLLARAIWIRHKNQHVVRPPVVAKATPPSEREG